jgi:hypothetical protein
MCVTYGVEHETAVSVESDLPFILMGFVLIVEILGRLLYVKVKVKEPRPRVKFKKEMTYGNDACQIYARAAPKPSGARLCSRRASQLGESSDGNISRDFSDSVVISAQESIGGRERREAQRRVNGYG